MDAGSVIELVRRRFDHRQGWVVLTEVRNRTGAGPSRFADAIALQTWPSRGIAVHGIEVKVDRGDLVSELRTPEKSAEIQRFCDRWWLVVADHAMVDGLEIPEAWGVLAPRGNSLGTLRQAPPLNRRPWTPEFVASVVRKFADAAIAEAADDSRSRAEKRRAAQLEVAKLDEVQRLRQRVADRDRDLAELRARISAFEAASGVRIDAWNAGRIGEAVLAVLDHRRSSVVVERARHLATLCADLGALMERACAEIEAVRGA